MVFIYILQVISLWTHPYTEHDRKLCYEKNRAIAVLSTTVKWSTIVLLRVEVDTIFLSFILFGYDLSKYSLLYALKQHIATCTAIATYMNEDSKM